MESLDAVFSALAHPTRRDMIARLVEHGESTAGELGEPFAIAQPTASRHLAVLEEAGIVTRSVEGRLHRFSLDPTALDEARAWIDRHRSFWEGSMERLAGLLQEPGA